MKVRVEQKEFKDFTIRYGFGVHIQQGSESVVLDYKGAQAVIAELTAWLAERTTK